MPPISATVELGRYTRQGDRGRYPGAGRQRGDGDHLVLP